MHEKPLKQRVKAHWEDETCGTRYGSSQSQKMWLDEIAKKRYELEPHIPVFADFENAKGKRVLEIGVGAGTDFENWVKHGAEATGIDLTEAAIEITKKRMAEKNIPASKYNLLVADAENLPFKNNEFDIVYSWGVLHHTPDTEKAFKEALRVLKPGGKLKAMIYHSQSITGFLLWTKNCLFKGNLSKSIKQAIFENLESPGTKSYSIGEAEKMLAQIGFAEIKLQTKLCAGDLLEIKPSKKYQSYFYKIFWKIYPRWLVRALGDKFGLELLIKAVKPHV